MPEEKQPVVKSTRSESELVKRIEADNKAKIEEWKADHKRVKAIVPHSRIYGKVPYIIAKPTASVMDAIAKYEHEGKMNKIEEVLINSCIKAGDVSLLREDIDLKSAILNKLFDLFERLEVEEKEL